MSPPVVTVEPPPALGVAHIVPPELDAFGGYTSAPEVSFKQVRDSVRRGCDACAILVRDGRVESVIVLDPGVGYGVGDDPIVPIVEIEPPKRLRKKVEP